METKESATKLCQKYKTKGKKQKVKGKKAKLVENNGNLTRKERNYFVFSFFYLSKKENTK